MVVVLGIVVVLCSVVFVTEIAVVVGIAVDVISCAERKQKQRNEFKKSEDNLLRTTKIRITDTSHIV